MTIYLGRTCASKFWTPEGAPKPLSSHKHGMIMVWPGSGPQSLSGLSNPAKSLKIDARLPEDTELIHQCCGDLVVRCALP